ncbi:MAG: hypothetical protein M1821_007746 [Bathelium mastoideum]|nr:MAG: hypothetical protein M1821_007746 [Bathelium mastoideum]
MLDRLPAEILSWIVQLVNVKSDLTSLSLVSRLLYRHVIPELYRSITIWAEDERDLTNFDLRILTHSTKNLQYVKNLQFIAPFQDRLQARCPPTYHSDSDEDAFDANYTSNYEDSLGEMQSDDESEYGLVSEEMSQNAEYDSSVHTASDDAGATATGNVENDGTLNNDNSDADGHSEVNESQMPANGEHEMFLQDMMSRLLPLFQNISESNLQSFRFVLRRSL